MINLHVSHKDELLIEKVAERLLRGKFIIDADIRRDVERLNLKDRSLVSTRVALLSAKTKALLFNRINEFIHELYPKETFEVYSTPIVHMDWEEAKHLVEDIVEV